MQAQKDFTSLLPRFYHNLGHAESYVCSPQTTCYVKLKCAYYMCRPWTCGCTIMVVTGGLWHATIPCTQTRTCGKIIHIEWAHTKRLCRWELFTWPEQKAKSVEMLLNLDTFSLEVLQVTTRWKPPCLSLAWLPACFQGPQAKCIMFQTRITYGKSIPAGFCMCCCSILCWLNPREHISAKLWCFSH